MLSMCLMHNPAVSEEIGALGDITEGPVSGFVLCSTYSLKLEQAGEVKNGLLSVLGRQDNH